MYVFSRRDLLFSVSESFFNTIKIQMIHHCMFHNVSLRLRILYSAISRFIIIGEGSISKMVTKLQMNMRWSGGVRKKRLNCDSIFL